MRRVYTAENVFDACIVRDRLLEQDIEAVVQGELLTGAIGELPPDSRPSVWVRENADHAAARRIIDQFEREDAEAGPDWHCRHCGEDNAATFALCWNCSQPQ
jgi:hypothetical protein